MTAFGDDELLAPGTMRCVEAGPDGVEYVAFGAGSDPLDAELVQGWWTG